MPAHRSPRLPAVTTLSLFVGLGACQFVWDFIDPSPKERLVEAAMAAGSVDRGGVPRDTQLACAARVLEAEWGEA